MPDIYNDENLRKNKVAREEIDQIMRSHSSLWLPLTKSRRGNERTMVIGFTLTGRILEVGIEIMSDVEETLFYFHVMDAGKTYRKKFGELNK